MHHRYLSFHPSVGEHLDCFHFLVIINNGAVNLSSTSFWVAVCFQLAPFYIPLTMYEGSNFSTSSLTFGMTFKNVYIYITILMDVKWYFVVVLICISLMANNVENFSRAFQSFLCLFGRNVYSVLCLLLFIYLVVIDL